MEGNNVNYEMISGDWWEGGRMEIGAILQFPGLGLGGPVRFEIDTGASHTVLAPCDAERLGLDYASLPMPISLGTIGRSVLAHPVHGIVYLTGHRQVLGFSVPIVILNPSTSDTDHSLLGLDVLRRSDIVTMAEQSRFVLMPKWPDSCLKWNPEE